MLSKVKPHSEKYARRLAKYISFAHPNVLTLLGSIPPVLFFVFILMQWYGWAILIFLLNVFDLLDGALARTTGKVSRFGGLLDSTLDRVSDALIISAFGFAGLVRWEIVIPLLIISYLVSYVRSRAELASDGKLKLTVGLIERTERLLIIFLSFIFSLFLPAIEIAGFSFLEIDFLILLFLSLITFLQRMIFAYEKLQ
jgi:archaetidylinositol phosphate synthase